VPHPVTAISVTAVTSKRISIRVSVQLLRMCASIVGRVGVRRGRAAMRLIQLLVVRACLGVGRPLSGLAGGLVRHLRELEAELEARLRELGAVRTLTNGE